MVFEYVEEGGKEWLERMDREKQYLSGEEMRSAFRGVVEGVERLEEMGREVSLEWEGVRVKNNYHLKMMDPLYFPPSQQFSHLLLQLPSVSFLNSHHLLLCPSQLYHLNISSVSPSLSFSSSKSNVFRLGLLLLQLGLLLPGLEVYREEEGSGEGRRRRKVDWKKVRGMVERVEGRYGRGIGGIIRKCLIPREEDRMDIK